MPDYPLTQTGQEVQNILDLTESGLIPVFNTSATYNIGDIVIYETKIYQYIQESSAPVEPGPESDYWQEVNLNTIFKQKQEVISSVNKLDASLVDDTNSTNKFVTETEKTTWSGKQDEITDSNKLSSSLVSGLGTAAVKDYTTSVSSGSNDLVTSGAVYTAIDNIVDPMVYKGSVGSGGTIEWSALPAAAASNNGFTYKVIEDHSTAPVCKVGDTIISNGAAWDVIPSGDEPSGTVTSVGMTVPAGLTVIGSPVTSSGTLAISYDTGYSIPTDTDQTAWSAKYDKPAGGIPDSDIASASTWSGKQDKLPDVTNADKALVSTGSNTYEWRDIEDVALTVLYKHDITLKTEYGGQYAYLSFSFYDDSDTAYDKASLVTKYKGKVFVATGNVMGTAPGESSNRTGIMRFSVGEVNESWSGVNSANKTWTFWVDTVDVSLVTRIGSASLSLEWDNIVNKPNVATQEWVQAGFTINGNLEVTGTITASSDRRIKENIKEFIPKKSILDLPVVEYDYIDNKQHKIGCIAQDLQEICPEVIHENCNGYLSVEENKLVYLLLLEVKKLRKELDELKGK